MFKLSLFGPEYRRARISRGSARTGGSRNLGHRVRQLFDAAIDLTDNARSELLDRVAGDADVRHAVEALLAAGRCLRRSDQLVSNAPDHRTSVLTRIVPTHAPLHIGARFGALPHHSRTRTRRHGTVFLAERVDGEFHPGGCALKVVRRTRVDSELIRRFRLERQVLCRWNTRNIARLLDGGSAQRASPSVMEIRPG